MEKKNAYLAVSLILSLALYPVLIASRYLQVRVVSNIAVPVFVLLMLANAVVIYLLKPRRIQLLLIAALCFAVIGDLIINLTQYYRVSPAAFIVCHVLLIVYFVRETGIKPSEGYYITPFAAVSLAVMVGCRGRFEYPFLVFGVLFYLVVLSVSGWRAVCYYGHDEFPRTKVWMIIAGGSLFFLTDVFSILRLLEGSDFWILLIWIVYPPCLVCLSLANWPANALPAKS